MTARLENAIFPWQSRHGNSLVVEQKKEQDHEMIQRELAMPIPGLRVTERVSDRAWQGSAHALSS